jgi:phosphonate transport system ATP-binding protein
MLDMPARRSAPAARAGAAAPVIRTRDLEKSYDRRGTVLRGIDLEVRAGECVALIGANGSGKSTLLRCLIGLSPISGGEVETLGEAFRGAPSAAQRARLRRQTGFVFQQHCLVRRLSALSNVVHGMLGAPGSWRGFSQALAPADWRARAQAALAAVNLADKALARADTLSGGQQQRVAIARALVRGPRLLIADEPAASLDPVAGDEVMALFARLARDNGITLLFTSHDMAQTLRYADRILALRDGRLCLDRPAASVTEAELAQVFRA